MAATPPTIDTPPKPPGWPFGVQVFFLILVIGVLVGGWFMITRVGDYYSQIQTGSVDVSAFSNSLRSDLEDGGVAANPNIDLINNFADDPSIGSEDAPLTIVMFADFECPFCKQSQPAITQAIAEYATTGKVRFVYRDFPLSTIHPQAQKAAEAGECADEQGAFWEYHDLLFENQSNLEVADLKRYAQQLRLNQTQFDACLDSSQYAQEVLDDYQDGLSAGVAGTPTLFFNGQPVSGVLNEDGLNQIIEVFIGTEDL